MAPRTRALHIAMLCAFAVSQPLFDLLERHPTFLVAHRVDALDLLLLAAALAWALPAALACAAWGLGRMAGSRSGWALHLALVALLIAATFLPVLRAALALAAFAQVCVAGALGAAASAAYARTGVIRTFTSFLSPVLIFFPALFLASAPIAGLLSPEKQEQEMPAGAASDVPVVVVVFDALPLSSLLDESGAVDRSRHPSFAGLADVSHWFRNATTVAQSTNYALPAILTGRYPIAERAPTLSEYPQNLFTVLGEGYQLNAFEPLTQLCPEARCQGGPARSERLDTLASDLFYLYLHLLLPADWARTLPTVTARWTNFAGSSEGIDAASREGSRGRWNEASWVFSRFLSGVADGDAPTLHFVHLNLPHVPFKYFPSGREYGPVRLLPHGGHRGHRSLDGWETTQALQRHLLQLAYADTLLGRLRERLEQTGLWDRSLVVVTADHGESFRPGVSARELSDENRGDILAVPLFVKRPGQRVGSVSDRNVETIDILPTIVDVLGITLPQLVNGRSLFDLSAPERDRKVVFITPHRQLRMRREFGPNTAWAADAVARIYQTFDLRRGSEGLFAVGPHRELLGRSVAELPTESTSPPEVRIFELSAFEDVDTDSGFIPAHVMGEVVLAGDGETAPALAVAVNGRIRALTHPYAAGGGLLRFTALVPESAFRTGRNQVEVFSVRRRANGPVLVPARSRARTEYSMVVAFDSTPALLLSSDGEIHAVLPELVDGSVVRSGAILTAHATDVRAAEAPETLLIFEEGRYARARSFDREFPDDVGAGRKLDDPELAYVAIVVPTDRVAKYAGDGVHFFALSGRVAGELDYEPSLRWRRRWPGPSIGLAIERRDGREGLAAGDGSWFPILWVDARARVERVGTRREMLTLAGAALEAPAGAQPVAVLIFVDGRFAESAAVLSEIAGFQMKLPAEVLEGSTRPEVRAFSLSADASLVELQYPLDYAF